MSESTPKNPEENKRLPPDPAGPPVASTVMSNIVGTGLTIASGGAALLFASWMMLPCVGATRSARLLKEQRQQAIAAALALQTEPAAESQPDETR